MFVLLVMVLGMVNWSTVIIKPTDEIRISYVSAWQEITKYSQLLPQPSQGPDKDPLTTNISCRRWLQRACLFILIIRKAMVARLRLEARG